MTPTPVHRDSDLLSWSMAKWITHPLVGLLVADGRIDLDAPAPVAAWAGDERTSITVEQLLEMRSGLAWRCAWVAPSRSRNRPSSTGEHAFIAALSPRCP